MLLEDSRRLSGRYTAYTFGASSRHLLVMNGFLARTSTYPDGRALVQGALDLMKMIPSPLPFLYTGHFLFGLRLGLRSYWSRCDSVVSRCTIPGC